MGGASVEWAHISYFVPNASQGPFSGSLGWFGRSKRDLSEHKVVLDNINGRVLPGQMMAILGPSGKLTSLFALSQR